MNEAEQLLPQLLEAGDIVGRDAMGRYVIQVAVGDAELDRLLAFGADAAEHEDSGDDAVPPVHPCWLALVRLLPNAENVWVLTGEFEIPAKSYSITARRLASLLLLPHLAPLPPSKGIRRLWTGWPCHWS